MNRIPDRIIVDVSSYGNGQKVPLIKGIRAYTGIGLKEAKEMSESGSKSLKLRKGNRPDEQAMNGIEMIKAAGAVIMSDGILGVIDDLEAAAVKALQMGDHDLAYDVVKLLKKWG